MVVLFGNIIYIVELKREREALMIDIIKGSMISRLPEGKKDNCSQYTLLTVFENCCAVSLLEFVSK